MLFILLIGLTILIIIRELFRRLPQKCKGLPTIPLYTSVWEVCRGAGQVGLYNNRVRPVIEKHGAVNFWNAGQWTVLVTKPQYLNQIFRNEDVIAKAGFYKKVPGLELAHLFGENIIDSHGDVWRSFISIMRPAILQRADITSMVRRSSKLVSIIASQQQRLSPGSSINVTGLVGRWTMDIFGERFLDAELHSLENEDAALETALQTLFTALSGPLLALFPTLEWVFGFMPSRRLAMKLTQQYEDVLLKQVGNPPQKDRTLCAENTHQDKMIYRLQRAVQEGKMSEFHYKSNLKILAIAGWENMRSSFTSLLWQIAGEPDIQRKLREEVDSHVPLSYTDSDFKNLPLMTSVIYETLRLYPPLSQLINRVALEDFRLGDDIVISKGMWVGWSAYGVHTDPNVWGPSAGDFSPERWGSTMDEIKAAVRSHQAAGRYIAFNAYSRKCLGVEFAMMQLKVGLCEMLRRFKWERDPHQQLLISTNAALTPEHCWLVMSPRTG
ncbi:cytochrome P450-dit2 [Aspergillus nanangensis]|uniref:Cytochrome P450-dit2 n=1 Tax=Aspergillus nanangensis TaxID=2582783 RepID=A0AAD4H126_ASPNN|nr:cytochrome P450-dit2 [Aspergillus nanangensis]